MLPEHTYPVALNQIAKVYSALINGDAVSQLGFETNQIVVTGESAGGNLAAALCLKLGMEILEQRVNDTASEMHEAENEIFDEDENRTDATRMPDAMMLSCAMPALITRI